MNIPAAEVQLTLISPGEMYVVGLGVHSEFPISTAEIGKAAARKQAFQSIGRMFTL